MNNKDRLRSVAAQNKPEDAWFPDREILAFQSELEHLYAQVQLWLKELIDDGTVRVSEIRQPVYEELLGSYEVPALLITIGRDTVKFKPSGTMYFGCKGSVTVEGPYGDIELSRVTRDRVEGAEVNSAIASGWAWCIETQSVNKPVFNLLNEGSFTDALLTIVEARGA